ncbi:MAG: cation diffusion facilitator family transporter [Halobacteriaceae archaeon]
MADGHSHDHGDGDGHSHSHGHGNGGRSNRKLAVVATINVVGFLVELAGGLLFGSVALLSDALHMLFDALAYVLAFAAAHLATTTEASGRWSFGLHRLEPLSAFLNGALLVPMVAYILWESVHRFLNPVDVATGPTLAIAIGGLVVNAVSVWVLEGGEMSLNERGAFYHLLGDAGGSLLVIVAVVGQRYTGIRAFDPAAAVLIAVVIVWSAWRLLRGSSAIFLLRSPVETTAVRAAIEDVAGVERVVDFHAWQICSRLTVATAHVETDAASMTDAEEVTRRVHRVLDDEGVDHATVELCPAYEDRPTHLDAHGH